MLSSIYASLKKCWGEAFTRMQCEPSKSQTEHYQEILKEKDVAGQTCTEDKKREKGTTPDAEEK